jgi:hypothetical protein
MTEVVVRGLKLMGWVLPALALSALASQSANAASCSFGASAPGEPSLQGVFNDMFGGAAPNAQTACVADPGDGLWHTTSSVGSATILVEITGNQNGNSLGIYDSTSTFNSLELFSGPGGTASRAYITVSGGPGAYHVQVDRFSDTAPPTSVSGVFASNSFGFYMQQAGANGSARFYSESFRNDPRNSDPGSNDYMRSYLGNGATFLANSLYAPASVKGTKFDADDALIAWEDTFSGSDNDYQDLVVLLRDVTPTPPAPVPLPAGIWLLGSAIAGLGGLARRRRRRAS